MTQLPEAKKSLGQHFLINQNVIAKITSDFKDNCDCLIEVGPGPGILTKPLATLQKPFHVIDKDERFEMILQKILSPQNVHITDALEFDLELAINEWDFVSKKLWLVSNLPYNVSTPLLIKFLKIESIDYMTLMFQREVADKVFSIDTREGKAMNSLMALSQTYFDVALLVKVPPSAFSPPPKVDSAVLSFQRKAHPAIPLIEFNLFESFVRLVFQHKRKQLGTVLKARFTPESITQGFEKTGISPKIRAEALALEKIQELYLNLKL